MELIMEINVVIQGAVNVRGKNEDINMINFSGSAKGEYFIGKVIGTGVDTQKIQHNGQVSLSARYMLEGEDYTGKQCRVFIENNGTSLNNCTPYIVTDSKALEYLQDSKLSAKVFPNDKGVVVKIYKV